MKTQRKLRHIINENFNISYCYVLEQERRGKWESFSTKGNPRKIHGLLYLNNCDCTYTLSNGTKKYAKKGDVVYLPPFCEYDSMLHNFSDDKTDDILIDMMFTDEQGETFYLNDSLKIFKTKESNKMRALFFDALNANNQPVKDISLIKSNAYKLLSYIGKTDKNRNLTQGKYKSIINGINYLENDIKQTLSMEEIAKMCNMSTTYFRRLFKEYSGISPIQFRINKRISNAKDLLANGELSVYEISEYLGFDNVTYFSKLFKKYVGMTPREYSNMAEQNN